MAIISRMPSGGGGGGTFQTKQVTPDGYMEVYPDSGYDGLSSVTVSAMPSTYRLMYNISFSLVGICQIKGYEGDKIYFSVIGTPTIIRTDTSAVVTATLEQTFDQGKIYSFTMPNSAIAIS